jgi:hypothetical protein
MQLFFPGHKTSTDCGALEQRPAPTQTVVAEEALTY